MKKRDIILENATPRSRQGFTGFARKGDAVRVSFTFTGIPVRFDEENPSKSLVEETIIQKRATDSTSLH